MKYYLICDPDEIDKPYPKNVFVCKAVGKGELYSKLFELKMKGIKNIINIGCCACRNKKDVLKIIKNPKKLYTADKFLEKIPKGFDYVDMEWNDIAFFCETHNMKCSCIKVGSDNFNYKEYRKNLPECKKIILNVIKNNV